MVEIIKELNIEVSKPNVFQAVVAKQYDMNTRFIKATFVDYGEKITIPQSDTLMVTINALRNDGTSKGFEGVINDDGTVTVPLHSWMLELVGTVVCDISVIDKEADDNKKLTTTSFTLLVEKAAWDGDGMTNDPQYDLLIELLNTVESAGEMAEEALQKSNEANSKYDACVDATNEANKAADRVDQLAFRKFIENNNDTMIELWVGTTAEYNAIEEKKANCFYITTDDVTMSDIYAEMRKALNGKIGFNRELTSEDDLDSLVENGVYVYFTGSIPQNCPYTNAGVVEVLGSNSETSQKIQRVTRYGKEGQTAFRALDAGEWKGWSYVATEYEDEYYKGCYYRLASNGEKEWINPPVESGAREFRTTERYGNNPIYTAEIELNLKDGDSGNIFDDAHDLVFSKGDCEIVRYEARTNSAILPHQTQGMAQYEFLNMNPNGDYLYQHSVSAVYSDVSIRIWFYKK